MFVDEADLDLYFRKALLFHIKHLQIQVGENINLQTYFQNVTNACSSINDKARENINVARALWK